MKPSPLPTVMAPPTTRSQHASLLWGAAGLAVLGLAYVLGWTLWQHGVVTRVFPATVLWCVIPYALTTQWLRQGAYLPHFEHGSYLFVVATVPFLLLPLGFALSQHAYSRGAVLLSYSLTLTWLWIGQYALKGKRTMRLRYLDDETPDLLRQRLGRPHLKDLPIELLAWHGQPSPLNTDGVLITSHAPISATRERTLRQLRLAHVRLYSVDALAEILSGRRMLPDSTALWELDRRPTYDALKRVMDIVTVVLGAPVWMALCLFAALLIKWDSPGPILFSQLRTGREGRIFRLWKLRTMRHAPVNEAAPQFAQRQDDRITRVGHFLRLSRLDELPQMWNVLRGEMSLIGPRPEQTKFVETFSEQIPAYPDRHLVRPGLTGWAQVQQGYVDNAEQTAIKLSYDLYYVAHYSLVLDLLIAYKTVRIMLTGFGAR